jgi:cytoskeletal protein CcmA (bactofilin family)
MIKFGRSTKDLIATPPMDDDDIPAPPPQPQLPAPRPVAAAPRARENELNAFLGRGCIYEGKLTFEGRVRIDGKFTGEIFSNDTLEIGPDAEIEGEIDVATLVVAGNVRGSIRARARCDLRNPAQVVGNITSPVVTMDEGVRFDGQLNMTGALDGVVGNRIPARRTGSTAENTPTLAAPAPSTSASQVTAAPVNGAAPAVRRNVPGRDPSDLLKPVP